MTAVSDMELCLGVGAVGAKRDTFCFYDAYESRAPGGRPAKAAGGPSGAIGAPEKTQVLYSVRWVRAPTDKGAAAPDPKSRAARTGEVKKLNMTMDLPQDGIGSSAVPVRMTGAYGI
eukprot:CAMPEP_0115210872 /NCGR_PEP_ID=MMETSP0270-20121206/22470_1 /TAXON_ID=71861 /ORGANISM="Scrippsiella trochoidea, Strain CCMP3099" /LENGTH=116 /DNA_ID=CAMNT_0002624539 /DNA_START=101 /DNA_END=451 /DNA_ORIENTATION=-